MFESCVAAPPRICAASGLVLARTTLRILTELLWARNFPVDKECVSYRALWNTFKRIAARCGLSDEDKAAVFHDCATRVYRLAPQAQL